MSGSGKTTLGRNIYKARKKENKFTVFLDGDHIREMFNNDIDHSIEGRFKNAERISNLCNYFDREGIDVVAAVLSIFPEWQEWNRKNFKHYYQIFLDVSLTTLISRDPKGLYKQAKNGKLQNFVGFDIEFPQPRDSDLVIDDNIMSSGIDKTTSYILEEIKKNV